MIGAASGLSALSAGSVQPGLRRVAAVVTLMGSAGSPMARSVSGSRTARRRPSRPPSSRRPCTRTRRPWCVPAWSRSRRTAGYDPAEILAETGIRLPALPEGWRVRTCRSFPSRDGHSVEIAVDDRGTRPRVALCGPCAGTSTSSIPTVARFDGAKTVYWQTGQLVYALTGTGSDSGHRTGGPAAVTASFSNPHKERPRMNTPYAWQTTTARRQRRRLRRGPAPAHAARLQLHGHRPRGDGLVAFFVASTPALYVPIFQTPSSGW